MKRFLEKRKFRGAGRGRDTGFYFIKKSRAVNKIGKETKMYAAGAKSLTFMKLFKIHRVEEQEEEGGGGGARDGEPLKS